MPPATGPGIDGPGISSDEQGFEIHARLQMMGEFVVAVAHELRSPITVVTGLACLLEDGAAGPLSQTQLDFVRQIGVAASHLELLVNDLQEQARLGSGTFRLWCEDVDLRACVRQVGQSFWLRAQDAGLNLEFNCPEDEEMAWFDPLRVSQVLGNLIDNAIKFTPRGGTVYVRAGVEDGWAGFSVADTGVGIAPEDIPRLFKRYSQLAEGHRKGGLGLGLSIAHSLIEAHGGDLGVESTLGQGSLFWFVLPGGGDPGTRARPRGQQSRQPGKKVTRAETGL